MSLFVPNNSEAVIARGVNAEVVGEGPTVGRLLLESSSIGGALSSLRVILAKGADGATPHHHTSATELFYVLSGRARILAGKKIVTLEEGDVAAVPPGTPHAFAATSDSSADLLIVTSPGIERFGYFRLLDRVRQGQATFEELWESQELYDNHFQDSPEWQRDRATSRDESM
ncbi:cupin domain-containing protein [Streptomyces sp. NPDC058664]|uniref:cupin domain-containing protein n=1 Tax=unclassified Streptomyces TaxID=2593676 RepID=UPI0036503D46